MEEEDEEDMREKRGSGVMVCLLHHRTPAPFLACPHRLSAALSACVVRKEAKGEGPDVSQRLELERPGLHPAPV